MRQTLLREMNHQRLADARAAMGRTQEQGLEKDAATAAKGGNVEKPDSKTNRLALPFRELAEQNRVVAKQRGVDVGFGGDEFVQQLFVVGEFAEEGQHQARFTLTRAADRDGHLIAHTATSALICGYGS